MQRYLLLMLVMALPFISQSKTTATKSRVTGVVNTYYSTTTSSFTPQDSTWYKYTGIRGGNMMWAGYGWQYAGKYDSTIGYYWDNTSAYFYMSSGKWQTFDASNNMTMQVTSYYDTMTHVWDDNSRYVYTYDGSNNQTSSLYQSWDTTHWTNFTRNSYTFSTSNDPATDTGFYWNMSTATWTPSQLNVYTYDTHHNLTSKNTFSWNMATSMWRNSFRYTYYVNSSYKQDSVLTESYNTSTSMWVNYSKHFYTYTSTNLIADTSIFWATASSAWRYSQLATYTYTGTDRTGETDYTWNTTTLSWTNGNKFSMLFDGNHNMKNKIKQSYISSSYVNSTKDSNDYNSYNQPTNYYSYSWLTATSAWGLSFGSSKDRFYYETYEDPTGITTIANNAEVKLYPCPAADVMTLDLKWENAQQAVLVIYDMNGRQWKQWQTEKTANYHSSVPVANLPAGNYMLSIQGADEVTTKQFSVVH